MTKLLLGLSALTLISIAMSAKTPPQPQFDVLIKNGRILDGSGRSAYNADIAIKGQRIARIGNLPNATAAKTIDARGLVLAPGFIDLRGMSKIMMGVTTEITGEGESIAPINDRQIKEQEDFLKRFNLTIDWR